MCASLNMMPVGTYLSAEVALPPGSKATKPLQQAAYTCGDQDYDREGCSQGGEVFHVGSEHLKTSGERSYDAPSPLDCLPHSANGLSDIVERGSFFALLWLEVYYTGTVEKSTGMDLNSESRRAGPASMASIPIPSSL